MVSKHLSTWRPVHWLGLALALLAVFLVWNNVHKSGKPAAGNPANAPVPVSTAAVTQGDVPLYLTGVGTVQPNATVTVKVQVDGKLQQVAFSEGQTVKAGQLLARIDPRALQAQLQQAEAQRARDSATLENARLDLQRYATLLKQNSTTQQTYDTQRAQVGQLEGTVQNDEAAVSYAKVQLSYTTITAPLSGRVGARLVDPGNIVHASDTTGLVVINQIDPISLTFTLPGEKIGAINQAQAASPTPLAVEAIDRISDQVLARGRLTLVNNQIDSSSGTIQLKATFANAGHTLWPGQYVNVHLSLGTRAHALTIPAAAVVRNQNGPYTWVLNPDRRVRMAALKIAQIQDGFALVESGLKPGERVVVDGQYKLKPGARSVEIAAPSTQGAGK
ncbi:efflux RND transporter periplasmic adaptor subunit [Paludibacterium yongneupense]|uniref:efflux RND transporter periplasmic adaptor subunit n=1 Tax=Paludibacterium yongneupense TaxID=400061 RepID=UPI0004045B50|nr:efflux RND transporter periplasmic adaptor subunit [Paludibacterium yongneupense]